jgi:hypothetical protein
LAGARDHRGIPQCPVCEAFSRTRKYIVTPNGWSP